MQNLTPNLETRTVLGFGQEWNHYDQCDVPTLELKTIFEQYFSIFPWDLIDPDKSVGADFGCGSGRWAMLIAPKVKELNLIDASKKALDVAKRNLSRYPNVKFHQGSVEQNPFPNSSLDFAFSLGVLHHLPDTQKALKDIANTLKSGAPLLVYLYYAFDNKPWWYRSLWKISDIIRKVICRFPFSLRHRLTLTIAALVYWPLARTAGILERINRLPPSFPLSYYRDRSFYIMKNDALDRFGTYLEKRYTRQEIHDLMIDAGFENISFSDSMPYWCAVGYKNTKIEIY
jgi:ubiquinone/menaquinone biosynthesis C-methylase UbiE